MLTSTSASPVLAPAETGGIPTRKIALLIADAASQAKLTAYCERHGFAIEPDHQFHLTLLASENEIDLADCEMGILPAPLVAVGFGRFGPDEMTPVLALETQPWLAELRRHFTDDVGAIPTYPDFRPHVSLSYAWDGTPALGGLPLPSSPLVFDRLAIRTFEPDDTAGDEDGVVEVSEYVRADGTRVSGHVRGGAKSISAELDPAVRDRLMATPDGAGLLVLYDEVSAALEALPFDGKPETHDRQAELVRQAEDIEALMTSLLVRAAA